MDFFRLRIEKCLNWKELPLLWIVSNACQFLLRKKQDDAPQWVAETWTTHPLQRAQKLMTQPLSASAHPPQYFLTSPLREFDYKAFHRILVTNEELKLSGTIRYAFNVKILIQ